MKQKTELISEKDSGDYDILSEKEEMIIALDYRKQGLVNPLIMWGCSYCKKHRGKSDFAIYNIITEDGDKIFCSKHGFLHNENESFRRNKPRLNFQRCFL